MASLPSWRGSWKTTTDFALTLSPSSSSCSSCCSSSTFIFSPLRSRTRSATTHRTNFSLDQNPSSSSSSDAESSSRKGVVKKKKPIPKGRLMDPTSFLLGIEEIPNLKSTVLVEKKGKSEGSSNLKIRLKSFFGKRPLWKRILFASKKVRSIILLNLIAVVYASNIPVVKEVEAIMDPAAFTVVRFAVAAIPFIPFVLTTRNDVQTRNAGIELGFWVSLGYLMQALGLLTSDAGRASFISVFTVIVVALVDGMLGATIPALTWFGAFLSIVGVTLLESSGSPPSVGDLLNFLSAAFFGIHMLRTEHISRTTKKENFLPLLGYQVCVIALFSAIWYFVGDWIGGTHGWDPSSWTTVMVLDWVVKFPWVPAIYTGVFSTGICLWVEIASMRDVSATEAAVIYGLEPLWGAGFAWFLLGERWGVSGWIGAALVLGGSLTVQIFGSSSPRKSKEGQDNEDEGDNLLSSDKRNGLSPSPVVVPSRKNVSDMLKK